VDPIELLVCGVTGRISDIVCSWDSDIEFFLVVGELLDSAAGM
jgi:hypothetical protein